MEFTAQQIASILDGKVEGNPEIEVWDFAKIEEGKPGTLTFLHNPKYEHFLYGTAASICIINKDFVLKTPVVTTLIRVEDPYMALTQLLQYYDQMKSQKSGIEEPVHIAKSAKYGEAVYLGAFAYIGEGVEIGENVKIYPHVYIGDHCKIGDNTVIHSGAKLYKESIIGKDCIIHGNAVIGADGFGFAPDEKGVYTKIPQIGNVILEDHVEIGAGTTIDRSTMGSTIIHQGVKLDNQVQVAHNVVIGAHTVIAAQTAIAGSVKVGKHNVIGGQVGIVGHIKIGDKVKIQAQSGVTKNLKDGAAIQGSPAFAYSDYYRSYVHFKNLPRIVERLNELENKLDHND